MSLWCRRWQGCWCSPACCWPGWRSPSRAGGRRWPGDPLALLLLAAAWWGFAGALELSVADPATRVLWGDLKYAGIVLVPLAWLVFVLLFTGRRSWVSRRTVGLLAVEPLLVLLVLAVPATHDLFRHLPASEVGEPFPVIAVGPLFWLHAGCAYLMVLVATVAFIRGLLRTSRVYRRLSAALAVAAVLPWLANLLFNLEVARSRGWTSRRSCSCSPAGCSCGACCTGA